VRIVLLNTGGTCLLPNKTGHFVTPELVNATIVPDCTLQTKSEHLKESLPFRFDLTERAMCFADKEYTAMQSVSHHRMLGETHLPPSIMANRNEVVGLIPYLGPELIAAIMKCEGTSDVDLQADSKSAVKDSLPALRSQSAVNENLVRVPSRRKASWLRRSRLFGVVCRLVAPWFQ
jgi:hypothetical protein